MYEQDYPSDTAMSARKAQAYAGSLSNGAVMGAINQTASPPLSVKVDAATQAASETLNLLRELRGRLFGFRPEAAQSLDKARAASVEGSLSELIQIVSECREFASELNARI